MACVFEVFESGSVKVGHSRSFGHLVNLIFCHTELICLEYTYVWV